MFPYIFLILVEVFWYTEMHKYEAPGVKNPEIMEMLGFGPSHYWTKLKQNNSPELLNLSFKNMCHKNDPKKLTSPTTIFSFPPLEPPCLPDDSWRHQKCLPFTLRKSKNALRAHPSRCPEGPIKNPAEPATERMTTCRDHDVRLQKIGNHNLSDCWSFVGLFIRKMCLNNKFKSSWELVGSILV